MAIHWHFLTANHSADYSIDNAWYYLIVIKVMFVDRSEDESNAIPVSQPYVIALGVSTVLVVLIGTILAQPLYQWALAAAQSLGKV